MNGNRFCPSCTMPLMDTPSGKRSQSNYCPHCTDANGNLKPKEEVQAGITGWFRRLAGRYHARTSNEAGRALHEGNARVGRRLTVPTPVTRAME